LWLAADGRNWETAMPLVNVMVNNRAYTIACDQGEEEHLKALGAEVDAKVKELLGSVGQVGDQRLILMAALLLADELHGAAARLEAAQKDLAAEKGVRAAAEAAQDKAEAKAADLLENAVSKVEAITAKLSAA